MVVSDQAESIIADLRTQGIKGVAFDFDRTITISSRGRVRKEKAPSAFEGNISPCFRTILPRLLEEGINVGVASFSDSKGQQGVYLTGKKLVRAFFLFHFGQDFGDRVPVVAVFPGHYQGAGACRGLGLMHPMPFNKQYHLNRLMELWQLQSHQTMLVDDALENLQAARNDGHPVRCVRAGGGVEWDDLAHDLHILHTNHK